MCHFVTGCGIYQPLRWDHLSWCCSVSPRHSFVELDLWQNSKVLCEFWFSMRLLQWNMQYNSMHGERLKEIILIWLLHSLIIYVPHIIHNVASTLLQVPAASDESSAGCLLLSFIHLHIVNYSSILNTRENSAITWN